MRNLPDSTYDMYERFKCVMHVKQERVDSLNFFLWHVVLNCVFVFFTTKSVVLMTEARLFRRQVVYDLY